MTTARGIGQDQIDQMVDLYSQNLTTKQIGVRFGLTGQGVSYHLKKRGVFEAGRHGIPEAEKVEMIADYESGMKHEDLAIKYGIQQCSVLDRLRSWGVKMSGMKRTRFAERLGLTDTDVVQKYNELESAQSVAEFYGVSPTAVKDALNRERAVFVKQERGRQMDRERNTIHRLYFDEYLSLVEIARQYGVGPSCLGNRFREWGWKAREATVYNTSIERTVASMLDRLGVRYEKQFKIGVKFFDFGLPNHRLLIETNGDYWHGNPQIFKEGELDQTQRASRRRDAIKTQLAKDRGYRLLFFWECDINENPDSIQTSILNAIGEAA